MILMLTEYSNEYTKIKNKYDEIKKKDTRKMLFDSIYTTEDLYDKLMQLYKEGDYTAYVKTHILLNYNTRNQDLDLKILRSDHNEDIHNKNSYMAIYKTLVKVYIRKYKTADVYGDKLFIIRNKKFITAMSSIYETRDKLLINNNSNLTTEITKPTPYHLNEVDILKILLK